MPRKLTEEEIQQQKDNMYYQGIALIKKKGIRNLTVEEITQATQMAKGTFYHFYSSKELFFYDVIKRNESACFTKLMEKSRNTVRNKENIVKIFEQTFLSKECLFAFLMPEELEYLIQRLPAEFLQKELNKSRNNFQMTADVLGIEPTEENYGTLSFLMDSLQTVMRSNAQYTERGRERAIKIIVNAIADFFEEETRQYEK